MPALPDPAAEALPAPQPATGVANIQPPSPHLVGHAGAFLERAGGELEQASEVVRQTNAHYDALFAEDGLNRLSARQVRTGEPQDAARQQAVQTVLGIRTHAMMNTNPYAAEKFLEDHLHEMGVPGVELQKQVQREVQQVQSRDVAQRFIFGNSK